MPQFLFHRAPEIISSEKYIDFHINELVRALRGRNRYEVEFDHYLAQTSDEEPDSILLRLNIACPIFDLPESWTISLKLHNERIDGVDFLRSYRDENGNRASGWHRHIWDPNAQNADRHSELRDVNNIKTINQFLIRTLSIMKTKYNAVDDGNFELFQGT